MLLPFNPDQIISALGILVGPGGAAWMAVKSSLNGTKKRVEEIQEDTVEIRKVQAEHGERLSRLEGKAGINT